MISSSSIIDAYSKILNEDSSKDKKGEYELVFSSNLAAEFTHTVNEFTNICAKMVSERNVSKDRADRFDELFSKIKNLIDAAKNS